MAKKKKGRRPRTPPGARPTGRTNPRPQVEVEESRPAARPGGGANEARRERKEQARQAREDARKRAARRSSMRRVGVIFFAGAIGLLVVTLLTRVGGPNPISQVAKDAAETAGCSTPTHPLSNAPGGQHLAPGETTTYTQKPATSGIHAPSPLPADPKVYTTSVDETQAVHFLEHAGILIYYRQSGDGALPQDVIDRLAQVANSERNTILAPYPDLPAGTALALAAWNTLQTCPVANDAGQALTADQADTIARGFTNAYVCTSQAPEPRNGYGC